MFLGIYNIYLTINIFYQNFSLKKNIFKNTFGHFEYSNNFLFNDNTIYKLYLYEFNEFLLHFIWKFINGILLVLPILLIIAYSTLLE
jgi:hypothetical protein